jgi:hypothetical protein
LNRIHGLSFGVFVSHGSLHEYQGAGLKGAVLLHLTQHALSASGTGEGIGSLGVQCLWSSQVACSSRFRARFLPFPSESLCNTSLK